jgi:hypothetical protein
MAARRFVRLFAASYRRLMERSAHLVPVTNRSDFLPMVRAYGESRRSYATTPHVRGCRGVGGQR